MVTSMTTDDQQLYKRLIPLETLTGYRRYFMDAAYWQAHVRLVCQRHRLTPCQIVRSGLPGSMPTFIVDERWVVKFFGQLFDGAAAFAAEKEINQLVSGNDLLMAPALLATGRLFSRAFDWSWPYLIFDFIPGVSIGEVYDQVSLADKLLLAQTLGEVTHQLHYLSPASLSASQLTWDSYVNLITKQYTGCQALSQTWEHVPNHLKEQITSFLVPLDHLIGQSVAPKLIHADLTADHILGHLEGGHWITNGLIDFGDAMMADFVYELIALHLDLFRCDKRLLAAYLAAYKLDEDLKQRLPHKAMTLTILHRFDVLDYLFQTYPQLSQMATFDELAALLWNIDVPGLTAGD